MLIDAFVFVSLPDALGAATSIGTIAAVLTATRWTLRALWELAAGA